MNHQLASPAPHLLDSASAARFAGLALNCLEREFPCAPQHVLNSAEDLRRPRELHPAFYGCFDWHSAVHAHWTLARLLSRFPDLPPAAAMRARLAANLTPANLQVEADYCRARPAFERPYGWAWELKLAEALLASPEPAARAWEAALRPLTAVILENYLAYLAKPARPVRSGLHANSAFGLACAWDYAAAAGRAEVQAAIRQRAQADYLSDRDAPLRWEPGGSDFLSPGLVEADLMRRLLPAADFSRWLAGFLPDLSALPAPAASPDRSDGQLSHLDGLNLSRAWCLQGIAAALPAGDARRPLLLACAKQHAAAGLAHTASGHYAGEHWLASFAVFMLETEEATSRSAGPATRPA